MTKLKKKNLIFLGAPGAGKGTVSNLMVPKYGLAHISTGDILRAEVARKSEAGKQAEAIMKAGALVPDELVASMVRSRLAEPDCREGFILDGFPRTIPQAELLENALRELDVTLDCVLYFKVSDEILLRRLTARLNCRGCDAIYNKVFKPPREEGVCDKCGGALYQRPDDSLETAKSRLAVFYKQTEPLIDFYSERKLLLTIEHADLDAIMGAIGRELE